MFFPGFLKFQGSKQLTMGTENPRRVTFRSETLRELVISGFGRNRAPFTVRSGRAHFA